MKHNITYLIIKLAQCLLAPFPMFFMLLDYLLKPFKKYYRTIKQKVDCFFYTPKW